MKRPQVKYFAVSVLTTVHASAIAEQIVPLNSAIESCFFAATNELRRVTFETIACG